MNEEIIKEIDKFPNKVKLSLEKGKEIENNWNNNEDGINQFLESIKNFGDIKQKYFKKFDSKIEFDEELIKTWLNNREFNSKLLYRKTRDGSTPKGFHNRWYNKGITITLIETTKGYKFGGYTELQWDNKSGCKKDKSTFIFSINKKQKFTARNDNDSIACVSYEGPRFGCNYPEIYLIGTLDKGQSCDCSSCTFTEGKILTNGETYWDVKELEVFKINYI